MHDLADAVTTDKDGVVALAHLGLRWSELAALRCEDVSLERRRVHVVQRVTEVDGRMDVDQPRAVPVTGMSRYRLGSRRT
ncbi:MAG: hypothetical protein ACRCZD_19485 [Phycicoccus sp.]